MESLFNSVPMWVWAIVAIIMVMFALGESILWDYEVKFPLAQGIGRGEVDLTCGKKKGTRIKYRFELEETCRGVPITIAVNGKPIHTISAEKNNKNRLFAIEFKNFPEPKEGDVVTVSSHGNPWFRGPLVLD